MSDFLSGHRRWREQERRVREFYVRFGFDPDATRESIDADYLRRSEQERSQIAAEWGQLMMDLDNPRQN